MFTVEQIVENATGEPFTVSIWACHPIRHPETTGFYILHEGLLGVVDGQLKEIDYDDIEDEPQGISAETTGGWVGITDKYWLTTLIPNQSEKVQTRFTYRKEGVYEVYQADFLGAPVVVPANGQRIEPEPCFRRAQGS